MEVQGLWVNPRVVSPEGGWLGQGEPEEGGREVEEEERSSTPETWMVTSGLAFPLQVFGM